MVIGCTDPPGSTGQVVLFVDRLATRPDVSATTFTLDRVHLFYAPVEPPTTKDVDCTAGLSQDVGTTITLDLTRTGLVEIGVLNAPPGDLHEIWLEIEEPATVLEYGLSRPMHPDLNCTNSADGVVRLVATDPMGFQIVAGQLTQLAGELNPPTDVVHADPDNGQGGSNGDLHGHRWSITQALPLVLLPPSQGTSLVDGQVVVRFNNGVSKAFAQALFASRNFTILDSWHQYYAVKLPEGTDERGVLEDFSSLPLSVFVSYVAPDTYIGLDYQRDPDFSNQVQWPQVGLDELSDGTPTAGWAVNGLNVGSYAFVVAVVDDGFDLLNPTLYPNFFINTDEVPQRVLDAVGDLNNDGVIDWHDLDADGDGILTFADLDATNAKKPNSACIPSNGTNCTPRDLVSGTGMRLQDAAGHNLDDTDCSSGMTGTPTMSTTWEDGLDGATGKCNGFIDDVVGWNFLQNNNAVTPIPDETVTNLTHGSTVAGIAGARGGDGIQVAGVAWQVRILPIQISEATTTFANSPSNIFRSTANLGFYYAANLEADIVNASFNSYISTGPQETPSHACGQVGDYNLDSDKYNAFKGALTKELKDIDNALGNAVVVVSAANCGKNHDDSNLFSWPQGMPGQNVMRVASVGVSTRADEGSLSDFSDYGTHTIDIAAPGESFVVLTPQHKSMTVCMGSLGGFCDGTSFASPMVAGAAALVLSAAPTLKSQPCQVIDRLVRNADALGLPLEYGGRSLNVSAALANSISTPVVPCQ